MSKKDKDKVGRPKIEINWDKVDECLEAGANGVQTAAYLGVHYLTLERRFKDMKLDNFDNFDAYMRHKRGKGDADLLLAQHKEAKAGCKTMLVWKGKTRLKQVEARDQQQDNAPKIVVNFSPPQNVDPEDEWKDE
jgi:hypothetical protein